MEHADPVARLLEGRAETLSPLEVAELLGVARNTVTRWITDGSIPAYRVGRKWLIPRDGLADALRAGANVAARSYFTKG